jgi:cobalt-zinc-cadmium efflux system membrane fusion protein
MIRKAPLALVVVSLALGACKAKPEPPAPEPKPAAPAQAASAGEITLDPALVDAGRVRVAEAERKAPRGKVHLPGQVVPDEGAEAEVTTLVSGRVASLEVSEGQRVEKGAVLATIDAPEIARATAELLRARSRALLAERSLARQLELEKQKATSQNAVDEARAADASARADVAAARTLLRNLGGSEPPRDTPPGAPAPVRVALRAPIAGVVVKRSAVLGGPVTAESVLFRIVAPERVVVIASQPETLGMRVAEGTHVEVTPRAGGKTEPCPGKVARNYGVVDAARTVPLRITLDGVCPGLAAGGYADVVLDLGAGAAAGNAPESEALVVPREAVVEVKGASLVFVERSPGHFVATPVRLGVSADDDVVVESGLAPGARVVVEGALLLKGELLRGDLGGE